MKKNPLFFYFFIFIALPIGVSFAQSDLMTFGYVQSAFTRYENDWDPEYDYGPENRINFMGINQLNLFFTKSYTQDITAFVNFEFTNNYSSNKGFGYFNLQEAYVRWDYKDYFRLKFGMVLPQFNAMYEIYNRFPLFPYIARPKMYETNLENVINLFDILPQKALIQMFGSLPINDDFNFEYAGYLGNPPNSFISSPNNDLLPGYVSYGQSATGYVSFGGRVGIKSNFLRLGASINMDRDNKTKFITYDQNIVGREVDLGSFNRTRIGFDISLEFQNFVLTAEYLKVITDIDATTQDSLNAWSKINSNYNGEDFDKEAYFITLQYYFTEKFYAFAMLDYLNDNTNRYYFGLDGSQGINIGAGYSVLDELILKTQVIFNKGKYDIGMTNDPIRKYSERQYQIGASFTF